MQFNHRKFAIVKIIIAITFNNFDFFDFFLTVINTRYGGTLIEGKSLTFTKNVTVQLIRNQFNIPNELYTPSQFLSMFSQRT